MSAFLRPATVSLTMLMSLLIGAAAALAQAPSCPTVATIDFHALVLPPPCDSCAITRAELAELQSIQQTRTPDMVDHARADYTRTLKRFLAGMGLKLKSSDARDAKAVFTCAAKRTEAALNDAKMAFKRMRPYNLPGNGLHILKTVAADDSPSYPSGHSAFGAVTGILLMQVVPELQEQLDARIKDFGMSRLISGVHFRSDVYAGELVGATMAATLLANDDFRKELDASKPALRQALGY